MVDCFLHLYRSVLDIEKVSLPFNELEISRKERMICIGILYHYNFEKELAWIGQVNGELHCIWLILWIREYSLWVQGENQLDEFCLKLIWKNGSLNREDQSDAFISKYRKYIRNSFESFKLLLVLFRRYSWFG